MTRPRPCLPVLGIALIYRSPNSEDQALSSGPRLVEAGACLLCGSGRGLPGDIELVRAVPRGRVNERHSAVLADELRNERVEVVRHGDAGCLGCFAHVVACGGGYTAL